VNTANLDGTSLTALYTPTTPMTSLSLNIDQDKMYGVRQKEICYGEVYTHPMEGNCFYATRTNDRFTSIGFTKDGRLWATNSDKNEISEILFGDWSFTIGETKTGINASSHILILNDLIYWHVENHFGIYYISFDLLGEAPTYIPTKRTVKRMALDPGGSIYYISNSPISSLQRIEHFFEEETVMNFTSEISGIWVEEITSIPSDSMPTSQPSNPIRLEEVSSIDIQKDFIFNTSVLLLEYGNKRFFLSFKIVLVVMHL